MKIKYLRKTRFFLLPVPNFYCNLNSDKIRLAAITYLIDIIKTVLTLLRIDIV